MKTLEETLALLALPVERAQVEAYISRGWVRPTRLQTHWYFEDIDIARLQLVCHLTYEIEVNDNGMDVILSLLDQLYSMRSYSHKLHQAISSQPPHVQEQIHITLTKPQ